ncbi:MAG: N-acetylmuramoyl-L-alanine amidase, partial [Gemmobacter sp.]|nr:N-acetylmuramoyl-L-alanine amidase [Gemmobacter sp.]
MRALVLALLMLWQAMATFAQQAPPPQMSALARLLPEASAIAPEEGGRIALRLGLSQPVPWRVRLLDAPPRVLLDFREVDWTGIDRMPREGVTALNAGGVLPGWSRLVAELPGPMVVERAGMATDGRALVEVLLRPATQAEFGVKAGAPEPPGWALPKPADLPKPQAAGEERLVVVLDPGHGGIDPGAESEGETEAKLMLT